MTEREVMRELDRLAAQPATKDDWLDLYETIEAYKQRCLARAIAACPQREALLSAIAVLAGGEVPR
jgi:hypothetical protein